MNELMIHRHSVKSRQMDKTKERLRVVASQDYDKLPEEHWGTLNLTQNLPRTGD